MKASLFRLLFLALLFTSFGQSHAALAGRAPRAGDRWRLNLYRQDRAGNAALALSPTLRPSFHTPERFGWLEFVGPAVEATGDGPITDRR